MTNKHPYSRAIDKNRSVDHIPYPTQVRNQARYPTSPAPEREKRKRGSFCCGCFPFFILGFVSLFFIAAYLLYPSRSNILILGIDYTDPGSALGRSDTILLSTIKPWEPYIGMLSIPRDLWVVIPGVGENRINTAHYFAEIQERGSGPLATVNTVETNFGVNINHYIRVKFDAFREVVTAMGGVYLKLDKPMAGYPPGEYHLKGRKALAFVRHRSNSDDFFRMENGQFMIKQILKQMLKPAYWPRVPAVIAAFSKNVDTDIPAWMWPRIILAILRVGPDGIDGRTITRDMVTPFFTVAGANVLAPNWNLINPMLYEMFAE